MSAASRFGLTQRIVVKPPRWSGYAKQSQPWRRGYDWARFEKGAHSDLPSQEAAEAWGYDFDSLDFAEFGRGIDFAQREQFDL